MKNHIRSAVACVAFCLYTSAFAQTPPTTPAKAADSAVTPVPRNDKTVERYTLLKERVKQNQGKVDVLFVGDSITQGWEGAGKETWEKISKKYKTLNIGIGGDRTQHVLYRLDNGNSEGIDPKVSVLMIGTNNSGDNGNTPEEIVEGVTAVVRKLQEKFPKTKVLLLGIFPRGEKFNNQRGRVTQINQAIQKLADDKKVFWLDFGHIFINPDGSIPKEIMPDYLHLTPRGYEMWAEAMEPKLQQLLTN